MLRTLLATVTMLALTAGTAFATDTEEKAPFTAKMWADYNCTEGQNLLLLEQSGTDFSENDRIVVDQDNVYWWGGPRWLVHVQGEPEFVFRAGVDGDIIDSNFFPERDRPTVVCRNGVWYEDKVEQPE